MSSPPSPGANTPQPAPVPPTTQPPVVNPPPPVIVPPSPPPPVVPPPLLPPVIPPPPPVITPPPPVITPPPPPVITPPPPVITPPPAVITPPPPIITPPPPVITPPAQPPVIVSSPPPPTPISPPAPVTPSPPPPSPTTPSPPPTTPPPLTPSPPPPSPTTPSPPLTPSPPPPSRTTPSPPRNTPSPPPPTTPSTPLTPTPPPPPSPLKPSSPPPPSPATPTQPRSFSSPPPPSTPTPPRSGTLSPAPPANPSGGGSSSPQPSSSAGLSTGLAVGIAIGGVALLVVLLTLICFFCKKKRRRDHEAPPPPPPPLDGGAYRGQQQQLNVSRQPDHVIASLPPSNPTTELSRPPYYMSNSSSGGYASSYSDNINSALPPQSPGLALGIYKGTFSYEDLSRATNGFSEANLLGQGGFGYVFKGMLPNGKEIAVKQLKVGSSQGEREFQAEVGIISRVHHKHLVALVGYCIADAQRLLVYEFLPNNTLEFHLHGKGRPPMAWSSRLKIAVGSAKGLSYLHENCNPKIIHRDIKAANILIDFNFEAKVADFGLAKIASDTNTHVSTRVMGTFGYMAPEYASSGKLTEKSDVFSFGVVLLELITGRRPIDTNNVHADNNLVDWARPLLNQVSETGNFEIVVDTRLNNDYEREEMARMVACAAACVRSTARRRPRMDQIVRVLEGNISPTDLNQGMTPGHSNVYGSSGGSSDFDSSQDNEGINYHFKNVGLETQDLYSNPISEHDLYDPSWSSSTDR